MSGISLVAYPSQIRRLTLEQLSLILGGGGLEELLMISFALCRVCF